MIARNDDAAAINSAEATLARDIERVWRHWKAFIAEKQDELAARQLDDAPDADLTGSGRSAPRKAKLDGAMRQQFGLVLESRRQDAQAKAERAAREGGKVAPDADQVYAAVLQSIADELDGKVHPSGLALVWYKNALIKFDAAAVMAGTTDADYLAAAGGSGPTRTQVFGLLGLIGVMLVIAYFMVQWAFGSEVPARAQAAGTAQVGQQATTLWTVETAAIGAVAGPAQMSGSYPAVLCLSEAATKAATPGATVVLTGTEAIRRYQVQPGISAREADLLLADCDTAPPTSKASARLVETRTRHILEPDMLRAALVRGPDLDPQVIPPDQMEITLDIAIPDAAAGTLVLADGRRWAATRSEALEGGTRLIYLVPLAKTAQPAGWELLRGSELPALLALNLPAPESRAALLRRLLDVQAAAPLVAERDGQPELALTFILTLNDQATPLTLLPTDLLIEASGVPTQARWDTLTLKPGKPTEIAVRVPFRAGEPLEIALANWRARITTE